MYVCMYVFIYLFIYLFIVDHLGAAETSHEVELHQNKVASHIKPNHELIDLKMSHTADGNCQDKV